MAASGLSVPVQSGNRLEPSDLSDVGWTRSKHTPSHKWTYQDPMILIGRQGLKKREAHRFG
jgi:hypothetical protein